MTDDDNSKLFAQRRVRLDCKETFTLGEMYPGKLYGDPMQCPFCRSGKHGGGNASKRYSVTTAELPMVCLPEFKAGRAEICRSDSHYWVRLPDGFLLPCGGATDAEARARAICGLVNVVMRWEGLWPPIGNIEAVVENNIIGALRWRASQGEPVPDLVSAHTNGERGGPRHERTS